MLAPDHVLAALRALRDAAQGPTPEQRRDWVELLAAEGARVLAAANLMKSMSPRLMQPDLGEADAAQGSTLLAAQIRRHAAHAGDGRGAEHPLHPQIEALQRAWAELADAAEALREAPADERQRALLHAELSWRRAHKDIQDQQEQGASP